MRIRMVNRGIRWRAREGALMHKIWSWKESGGERGRGGGIVGCTFLCLFVTATYLYGTMVSDMQVFFSSIAAICGKKPSDRIFGALYKIIEVRICFESCLSI